VTIDQLETSAVVVGLGRLEANIAKLADYARRHGLRLRPHTKTHKIPKIAKMQMEAGTHGITVAKSQEGEVMAAGGLDDILLAYPIFGEINLKRLATLASKSKITIAVDSAVTAAISEATQAVGANIDVLVEIDVGMKRCGVASAKDAEDLAKAIDILPGVRFAGLNLYPGHIWARPADQAAPLREVTEKLAEVLDRLYRNGFESEVVSGGSTPTAFQSHFVSGLFSF
jgi:D-serine deaminase-like pyridoxal phosphate-dependent protein